MSVRTAMGMVIGVVLGVASAAAAQSPRQGAVAKDLAAVMVDEAMRRDVNDRVGTGMARAVGLSLEDRLGRRLLDVEWRLVAQIVQRFVADTLPERRIEEIAAEVYARHFDEAELQELLRFHESTVGRKAARLAPVIAGETVAAIDQDIRTSTALPQMLDDLQRGFPALGKPPQSP